MKLASVFALLHLAQAQVEARASAPPDRQYSFERATLWYLNQAQDALVAALREHHGLRGVGDETQTIKELASRDLPSAAGDQLMSWPYWGACRKALRPRKAEGLIGSIDEDQALIAQGAESGYATWLASLDALCLQMQGAYAEF